MPYRAVLERWKTENILYINDLPGCMVKASTVDIVMAAAPEAMAAYFRWAIAHHIALGEKSLDLAVVEEGRPLMEGVGPFFSTDAHPLEEADFTRGVQVIRAALGDLLALYEQADEHQRTYKFLPHEWSARDVLMHIVETDLWYATRLRSMFDRKPDFDPPTDPIEAVHYANAHVDDVMRDVFYNGRNGRFENDFEEWTLRKLIRRRAAHLREHYPQMLLAVRQRVK